MERRQFDTPRRISIGKTCAYCEQCGCEEFFRLRFHGTGENSDMMACAGCGCGHEHVYTALFEQISQTVMRQAEQTLANAEALRKRLEKVAEAEQEQPKSLG